MTETGAYLTVFCYACKLTSFVLEGQMKKASLSNKTN